MPRNRPLAVECLERRLVLSTFLVNSDDDADDSLCDASHCSLREALVAANAANGIDSIEFQIPGSGPHSIRPLSELPTITDPVRLDGTTQLGFMGRPIIELDGSLAGDRVTGLRISAGSSIVRGLVVNRFSTDAIALETNGGNVVQGNFIGTDVTGTMAMGNGADGVYVVGGSASNIIGTNGDGVNDAAEANLISDNGNDGVHITGRGSDDNVVAGNLIGTDLTGTVAMGNENYGVEIRNGAQRNRIGTNGDGVADASERNVISDNAAGGILIQGVGTRNSYFADFSQGAPAEFTGITTTESVRGFAGLGTGTNLFANNFLRNTTAASNANGTLSQRTTLTLTNLAAHTAIDLNFLFAAIDSWDTGQSAGPDFFNVTVDGTTVFRENFANGVPPNPDSQGYNAPSGVPLRNRPFTNLGFDTSFDSAWNLGLDPVFDNIPHTASTLTIEWFADGCCWTGGLDESWAIDNVEVIVDSSQTSQNVVAGNLIGTDVKGTAAIGNTGCGVTISAGATNNLVGTNGDGVADASERNLLAGSKISTGGTSCGVAITGGGTDRNRVAGNFIGTDISGTQPIPNEHVGVLIARGAQMNVIGTDSDGMADDAERNVISANLTDGVFLRDQGTDQNQVAGNFIGTDVAGTAGLGNGSFGVLILQGPQSNRIGTTGTIPAGRNVVSANEISGVSIQGSGADHNIVAGNFIGTDVTGASPLGNKSSGVFISNESRFNVVGTDGDGVADFNERNVISANSGNGITISGAETTENIVAGNYIGTNADGTEALPNTSPGVALAAGAQRNVVGTNGDGISDVSERNVISGNLSAGVYIRDAGSNLNVVAGNYIGTDASGTGSLGNDNWGVLIELGAQQNVIGTNGDGAGDLAERNVISSNLGIGVEIRNIDTDFNSVAGNFVGTNAAGTAALGNTGSGIVINAGAGQNRIGTNGDGTADAAERNLFSGVLIIGGQSDFNVVAGNFIGTDSTGRTAIPNANYGVDVRDGAQNNRIGAIDDAHTVAERNVISANGWSGVAISGEFTFANHVTGNYIGTNVAGTAAIGNQNHGIVSFGDTSTNYVGRRRGLPGTEGASNVISGNQWSGISISDDATLLIYGNLIGTDAAGTADLGNGHDGVTCNGTSFSSIGEGFFFGLTFLPEMSNVIAFNQRNGIAVLESCSGFINANSIFSNGGLGIDLGPAGVTANDPFDIDTGPNGLQNFPILRSVTMKRGVTTVRGTLASVPNSLFLIDFFSSSVVDASGNGEGQVYLGTIDIKTKRKGTASFSSRLAVLVLPGEFVTATATGFVLPDGTSEFSPGITFVAPARRAFQPAQVVAAFVASKLRLSPETSLASRQQSHSDIDSVPESLSIATQPRNPATPAVNRAPADSQIQVSNVTEQRTRQVVRLIDAALPDLFADAAESPESLMPRQR